VTGRRYPPAGRLAAASRRDPDQEWAKAHNLPEHARRWAPGTIGAAVNRSRPGDDDPRSARSIPWWDW